MNNDYIINIIENLEKYRDLIVLNKETPFTNSYAIQKINELIFELNEYLISILNNSFDETVEKKADKLVEKFLPYMALYNVLTYD